MIVSDVLAILNDIAPFDKAEPWDNSGLLAGSKFNTVTNILCALDFSKDVLEEAVRMNANLIVTHHPILFSGRKNLVEDDYEGALLCDLIRKNISLIAVHTNYDIADGGVSDCLARHLLLKNIRTPECSEEGYVRIGETECEITLGEFENRVASYLGDAVRVYGDRNKKIRTVCVCGGSGGEFAKTALKAGADVFVTGEMRYHDSFDLMHMGLATIHAGHDATERIALKPLRDGLQNRIDAVQYNVKVFLSDMGVEK